MLKAASKLFLLAFCLRAIMGMSSMNPYKRQGTGTWESRALRNRGKSVKAGSYRGVYFIMVLSALPRNQY